MSSSVGHGRGFAFLFSAFLAGSISMLAIQSFLQASRDYVPEKKRNRKQEKQDNRNSLVSIDSISSWFSLFFSATPSSNHESEWPHLIHLIGNTPVIEIKSLSKLTGCTVLAKVEFLNPGGSTKDRVAYQMIQDAEDEGLIRPHAGDVIVEGTVGSTRISLAMIAKAKGYECVIFMPNDQAKEKIQILESLGAKVIQVHPCSIIDKNHFVNLARQYAIDMNAQGNGKRAFFCDQFENRSNFKAHFSATGPEIYKQTNGNLDAFVMGAGTGGTLAGVAQYLKPRIPNIKIILADPDGSGLRNKVKYNVMYSHYEAEGTRKRHQVDTIVEGVGINRLTKNFTKALELHGGINDAIHVSDKEALAMSRFLMDQDGIFVGSSSSVNCAAVVKYGKKIGPGHTIMTLLCDHGSRHLTKFWNADYLRERFGSDDYLDSSFLLS